MEQSQLLAVVHMCNITRMLCSIHVNLYGQPDDHISDERERNKNVKLFNEYSGLVPSKESGNCRYLNHVDFRS